MGPEFTDVAALGTTGSGLGVTYAEPGLRLGTGTRGLGGANGDRRGAEVGGEEARCFWVGGP